MRPWIILFLALSLLACDDPTATDQKQPNAEQVAEQRLMSELATAVPELEKRLTDWISFDKGFVFIIDYSGEPSFGMNVMPASTPWHVSCNSREIEVTIGNFDEGKGRNARLFTRPLSFARFSEEQCKLLAAVVARKMMGIAAGARSP